MIARVRTLPIRVPPLPGEALDSLTEALARRLDSPLGEVLHHLGLPPRTGHGDHLRGIPRDWTIMLSGAHTTNIAHASGLDERTVTDMTLMYYDGRAVLEGSGCRKDSSPPAAGRVEGRRRNSPAARTTASGRRPR